MKRYKGLNRFELIEKIVDARVEECRKQNFEKFGNNDHPRQNENRNVWKNLYKTYPITSKDCFCLARQYDRYYM